MQQLRDILSVSVGADDGGQDILAACESFSDIENALNEVFSEWVRELCIECSNRNGCDIRLRGISDGVMRLCVSRGLVLDVLYMREDIIRAVNQRLGQDIVSTIKVVCEDRDEI